MYMDVQVQANITNINRGKGCGVMGQGWSKTWGQRLEFT